MNYNRKFGSLGEKAALHYLRNKGYRILHTNWYCQWGEIDLVAKKGGQLVFFEIKTRQSNVLETISPGKMKRLSRSVQFYVQRYGYSFENFQVDFIGIERVPRPKLLHLKNILEMRI